MGKIDKNAEKFANLMIEKIESLQSNWQKPWFTKGNSKHNFLPMNLSGRLYRGGNAFLLHFLCEKNDYTSPIFITFKQANEAEIRINKGSESFPVYYVMFCAYHIETKEKISLEDYKKLTEEAKKKYRIVSNTKYYLVFNLDQTNYSEVYPKEWNKIKENYSQLEPIENNKIISNEILDNMIENKNWVCDISNVYGDKAYFSPSKDVIVLPEKKQFADSAGYYSTMLHEMSHSTGTKERLNRRNFYDRDIISYGKEELVAELSAALSGINLGVSTTIREENAAYLKSWCKTIKEEPKYILSVLNDASKSAKYITQHLGIAEE